MLSWLVDRARIRELTARYNRCFDDGDPEGFAATFTEDGVMEVDGGLPREGRAALAEMVRHTPYGIVHVTVDATVEVDGDRAVQDVTLLVLSRPGPDAAADKRQLAAASAAAATTTSSCAPPTAGASPAARRPSTAGL